MNTDPKPFMSHKSEWERMHGSAWDRQPIWLRWIIGIVMFLWFVPPMALVAIKMVMQ